MNVNLIIVIIIYYLFYLQCSSIQIMDAVCRGCLGEDITIKNGEAKGKVGLASLKEQTSILSHQHPFLNVPPPI